MENSEIRQDKISKQWVIFAPARGKRPKDMQRESGDRDHLPEHEASCPFCPGNENMLPSPVLEMRGETGKRVQVKVIPNKYPAITPSGEGKRIEQGPYLSMEGRGRHEVIIETPAHNKDIPSMTHDEITTILQAYQRRFIEISENIENSTVVIFRNHGKRAGTSLIHPHSQLIATSWIPRKERIREVNMRDHYDSYGTCVFCHILDHELSDRSRVILETRHFAVMTLYAAQSPFHCWLAPKSHNADFGSVSQTELSDLAQALKRTLSALHGQLHDPDYNYVINTAPRYQKGQPHIHWHLEIRPRLVTRAGFELGSGIRINPSLPEDDAEFLRAALD
jgi:UDPglucose--hexose-1-phosphate uridylyltransferase